MGETSIEWTDTTWNPVRGCSRVSPGCDHCYAMGQAHRFSGPGKPYEGLTTIRAGKVDWSGVARFVPAALAAPLSWRKPRKVFVNSMSDLFHHSVTDEQIAAVFGVMAACPQHTFQVLTKRPGRALEFFGWLESERARRLAEAPPRDPALPPFELLARDVCAQAARAQGMSVGALPAAYNGPWPLPNVWLGTSCEDQAAADKRIPDLLRCPAAVRFVSAEPLLGPVLFDNGESSWLTCNGQTVNGDCCERFAVQGEHFHGIDWVIVGGESGPGARPCNVEWIRSIVEQCKAAGVACFVKQLGRHPYRDEGGRRFVDDLRCKHRKGGDPAEWPAPLRVRDFPSTVRRRAA